MYKHSFTTSNSICARIQQMLIAFSFTQRARAARECQCQRQEFVLNETMDDDEV